MRDKRLKPLLAAKVAIRPVEISSNDLRADDLTMVQQLIRVAAEKQRQQRKFQRKNLK